MAANVITTEKPTRQDTLHVSPDDVVVVRNSRCVEDPNQDDGDKKLAASIATVGQEQPIAAYRDGQKRIVIKDGHRRLRAVKLLRTGFTYTDPTDGQTRTFHDPAARVWVAVDTGKQTEESIFVDGLTANVQRENLTDLQEALAQATLRDEFHWPDTRIAAFFGYSNQNRVMALKKLANAPEYIQTLVHTGKLAVYVYSENLFDVDPKSCKAAVEAATDPKTGAVNGAKVREYLRAIVTPGVEIPEREEGDDGSEPTEKKPREKSIGRTMKNVKDFLNNYLSDDNTERNEKAVPLCTVLQRWVSGELKTDRQLLAALDEIR